MRRTGSRRRTELRVQGGDYLGGSEDLFQIRVYLVIGGVLEFRLYGNPNGCFVSLGHSLTPFASAKLARDRCRRHNDTVQSALSQRSR